MRFLGNLLALTSVGLFIGAFYVDFKIADYMIIASLIFLFLAGLIEVKTYKSKFDLIGCDDSNKPASEVISDAIETKDTEGFQSKEELKQEPVNVVSNTEIKAKEFSGSIKTSFSRTPAPAFNSEPDLDWDEDLNFKSDD